MKGVATGVWLGAMALAAPAYCVGADDEAPPEPTQTTTTCEEGMIWDEEEDACVAPQKDSLNDTTRYHAIRELAYAGRYDDALHVLGSVDHPEDARMLNYQGFVHRKLGDMKSALRFYRAALAADPDYLLARSYLGQGLAAQGQIAQASYQLAAIAHRGGQQTWAYQALARALAGDLVEY